MMGTHQTENPVHSNDISDDLVGQIVCNSRVEMQRRTQPRECRNDVFTDENMDHPEGDRCISTSIALFSNVVSKKHPLGMELA